MTKMISCKYSDLLMTYKYKIYGIQNKLSRYSYETVQRDHRDYRANMPSSPAWQKKCSTTNISPRQNHRKA